MILAKKSLILQIWTLMKTEDDVQVHKPENIQEFQISKIISKCLCTFKVKIIHIVCFFSFSGFGYHKDWWFCIILLHLCSKCLHSSMIRNKTHAMAWDWSKRHHAWTMNLSEETTETFSHLQWLVSHLPKKTPQIMFHGGKRSTFRSTPGPWHTQNQFLSLGVE